MAATDQYFYLINHFSFKRFAVLNAGYVVVLALHDAALAALGLPPGVAGWYPPGGLSFAFLLAFGPGYAPAVFIASLLSASFIYHLPYLPNALLWAAGLTGVYAASAGVLRSILRIDLTLLRIRDLTLLVLTAWVVPFFFSLILVSAAVAAGASAPAANFAAQWLNETIALLTITPFLLIHIAPYAQVWLAAAPPESSAESSAGFQPAEMQRPHWAKAALLELIVPAGLVVFLLWAIFGPGGGELLLYLLLFLPLIWVALRRGLSGAAVAVFGVSLGVWLAARLFNREIQSVERAQLLLLTLTLTSLYLGAVVSQRQTIESIYRHLVARLAQATLNDATARREAEARAARHAEQLVIINEVGRALAETLDLPEVLDKIAQVIHKLFPDVKTLFVSLYDAEKKLITVVAGRQEGEPVDVKQLSPTPLQPAGQDPLSRAIDTGQPLIIAAYPARLQEAAAFPEPEAHAALYTPMKAKSKVIGVLQVHSPVRDRFTEADAELLNLIGSAAAIAIQNARLFAENLQRLETIGALNTTAQKLSFNLGLQRLAHDITRTCVQGYGARLAWLGRAEADGRVKCLAYYPESLDYPRQLALRWDSSPEGQGLVGRALRTGFPAVADDVVNDPGFAPWREIAARAGWRSSVALPLISRDKPFGVLNLYSDEINFFDPRRVSFLQAYTHQAAAALENARLFEETDRHVQQVQALHIIDMAINASTDLPLTLKVVLEQVIVQLNVDAAAVLLYNERTQNLEHVASRGFTSRDILHTRLRLGEGLAGRVALERQAVTAAKVRQAKDTPTRLRLFESEGFDFYYAEPLIAKGQLKGVFELFHRAPLEPTLDWLDFLETIAGQTAIAIDNTELFAGLQRSNLELALAYDSTLEGWSRALDLRDKETEGHSQRVTDMTLRLARAMNVPETELVNMRRGALLHDIGKMGVPDQILLKPGPLTEEEWSLMKKHPVYAYEMLSPIAYLRPALDIPYCHHEKWDGAGYPRGLRAEQIPLAARIFAVVDVWDALCADRPYRPAWPPEKVRGHIRDLSGAHFDPKVVETFLKLV